MSDQQPRALDQVVEDIRALLQQLELVKTMAKMQYPDRTLQIAIVAKDATGGNIIASFEFDLFTKDIEALVGNPLTDIRAAADKLKAEIAADFTKG